KLAISTGDWESVQEMNERMDRVWGSIAALRSATTMLYYRGREIDPNKARPWTWLRNYLHARRLEAVNCALPIGTAAEQIDSQLPGGLRMRSARIGGALLRRRAALLASSDLRSRDREDDTQHDGRASPVDHGWLRAELNEDEELRVRLVAID